MNNTGRGNPSRDEMMHTPPIEAPALAASPERFIPSHSYRLLKCAKGMDIGGYTVIRVVSADYGFQPAPLPRNGLMHTSSHFESDLPNFTRQSGTHRTAHQHKLPVPRASAAVRKPEDMFYKTCPRICGLGTYVASRSSGRKMLDSRKIDDT